MVGCEICPLYVNPLIILFLSHVNTLFFGGKILNVNQIPAVFPPPSCLTQSPRKVLSVTSKAHDRALSAPPISSTTVISLICTGLFAVYIPTSLLCFTGRLHMLLLLPGDSCSLLWTPPCLPSCPLLIHLCVSLFTVCLPARMGGPQGQQLFLGSWLYPQCLEQSLAHSGCSQIFVRRLKL